MPLTLAAGSIAHDSVSEMPACSAPSRSKSFRFSLWSGQAGYPNAGRMPRKRSAISCSGLSFDPVSKLVEADAGGDRERADMVAGRSDVVRKRPVRSRVAVGGLLAKHRETDCVVTVDNDIVAVGRRRPEAVDAARGEQPAGDDLAEQLERVVVEVPRRRLLENRRELPLQLPGVEEELPVDELAQRLERRLGEAHAGERRGDDVLELDAMPVFARLRDRQQGLAFLLRVLVTQPILKIAVVRCELLASNRVEQVRDDSDDARRVEHVHNGLRILRSDLHGG